MKLDIESLAREAGLSAGEAAKFRAGRGQNMTVLEKEELQKIERFARLIVERCAVECDVAQQVGGNNPKQLEAWALLTERADAIRQLMEDK